MPAMGVLPRTSDRLSICDRPGFSRFWVHAFGWIGNQPFGLISLSPVGFHTGHYSYEGSGCCPPRWTSFRRDTGLCDLRVGDLGGAILRLLHPPVTLVLR